MTAARTKQVRAGVLDIACEETGDTAAPAVILLHGFPYDVRAFDGVVRLLEPAGLRVIVPHLRGFGPTRFADAAVSRSGQQAALAHDLIELMDALAIGSAIVGGFDWGGRAACIVSALWPARVDGLVTVDGYNVQDLASAGAPAPPEHERSYWYQYYFHSERGRRALADSRDELCGFLWETWSPSWPGAREAFAHSAPSLHNPDFVEVVTHSYRHRFGLAGGDPRYQPTEDLIAAMPPVSVPAVILESGSDGVLGGGAAQDRDQFTGPYEYALLPGIGHNVPQEAPQAFAAAVLSLAGRTAASAG
ncbi:MAG: alpha/beta hydrolase [Actinomycetota bacterium]